MTLPQNLTGSKTHDWTALSRQIKAWGLDLGFQQVGICDIDLEEHGEYLQSWLQEGYHGELSYMESHGPKRFRPELLVPGTIRVITLRMDYLPQSADPRGLLASDRAEISRYAQGRDYHKLIRKRLAKLANKIEEQVADHRYRVFVDSAPVLERALAENSGLGWIGKNTMLLNREAGSYFFLGEIYTNLPLPVDEPTSKNHCGDCVACLDICPTQAFVAPYVLDARRCISYLTIELKGSIPVELRSLMGNRVFGCDDCQTICPWNKFAQHTDEDDFQPRHQLNNSELITLFKWTEDEFLEKTAGSAIRRVGYQGWLRNLAVALGNAPATPAVVEALMARQQDPSELVREHVLWALAQHGQK